MPNPNKKSDTSVASFILDKVTRGYLIVGIKVNCAIFSFVKY